MPPSFLVLPGDGTSELVRATARAVRYSAANGFATTAAADKDDDGGGGASASEAVGVEVSGDVELRETMSVRGRVREKGGSKGGEEGGGASVRWKKCGCRSFLLTEKTVAPNPSAVDDDVADACAAPRHVRDSHYVAAEDDAGATAGAVATATGTGAEAGAGASAWAVFATAAS